jgi:hypothetical protein
MGQESDEIWTAETLLQPILPQSDRLLEIEQASNYTQSPHRHYAEEYPGNHPIDACAFRGEMGAGL